MAWNVRALVQRVERCHESADMSGRLRLILQEVYGLEVYGRQREQANTGSRFAECARRAPRY
eukprot:190438-Pleurochrysis_carterae.AAC.5